MSGQTISTSETRVEALKLQSSAYGVTIPLVFGLTKISGNVVWYNGFKAIPHTSSQGGKGGGVKVQNTTFTYQASVIMGLCRGRISGIPRIWRGKKLFQGGVTPAQLLSATETYTPPGSGAMVYTLAHAATFAALIRIDAPFSTSEPWNRRLQLGTDYAIAAGVVTVLADRWRGVVLTIRYQYTTGTVATTALDDIGLTFLKGDVAQAAWSALSAFPAEQIGYSGLAAVAGQDYDLGTGAQVENHTFEVVAPMAYHLGTSVPDVDPAKMLLEVLVSGQGGASFPADYLDEWQAWSDFCVASGLLVSPALTEQQPAADVLRMAARLTNAGPVWSGGRLKMVPYADTAVTGNGVTFTPSTSPVYDLDDDCYLVTDADASPVRCELKSPADRYNHVRVQYLNRANQYNPDIAEAKDKADIDANGLRSMDIVRAHWICDGDTARLVAQNLLQRSLYVCTTYGVTLPWHFALLEPMDINTLTDTRLEMSLVPVRVTVMEENEDGDLSFEFEDYPAGQASAALYPSQIGLGYAHDYNAAPGNADAPIIFEVPVERTLTGLALYVSVKGSGANWGGAQVWVSQDGSNYKQIGTVYGSARAGTLSANASAGASAIAVQGLGSAQLVSGSAADATALNTLCYVGGANPEYFAYQTATLTGAGAYTLSSLVHGAYGTAALAHSTGDVFVRVDERVAKSDDLDITMIGKTIYVKLCSFNLFGGAQQGLADVSATTYTITGGMARLQRQGGINLIDAGTWRIGSTGSQGGNGGGRFNENASHSTENSIVLASAPDGINRAVWRGIASGPLAGGADGGWDGDAVPIDPTKLYRFVVWIKPSGAAMDGYAYLGCGANSVAGISTGTPNGNPYFFAIDRSTFVSGRWYLIAGFVLPYDIGTTAPNPSMGGIYDCVTGKRLAVGAADFKWASNSITASNLRAYQFYSSAAEQQLFWGPRLELCDGTEPALDTLLQLAGSVNTSHLVTDAITSSSMSVANSTATAFTATGSFTATHTPVGFWTFSGDASSKLNTVITQRLDIVSSSGSIGSLAYVTVDVDLLWDGAAVPSRTQHLQAPVYVKSGDKWATFNITLSFVGTASDIQGIGGIPAASIHEYAVSFTVTLRDSSGAALAASVSGTWESNTLNDATEFKK